MTLIWRNIMPLYYVNWVIGQKIRKLRLSAKMTMKDLGSKLGVSFQQVQKYESGKDSLKFYQILKICHFCNYDLQALASEIYNEVYVKHAKRKQIMLQNTDQPDLKLFEFVSD